METIGAHIKDVFFMQTRTHFTTAQRNFLEGELKISSTTGYFLNDGQQVTTSFPVLIYLLIN